MDSVNPLLYMFYVLLALSVVVSLFGIVNTLVLSVFERTRELGMLRAIGMTCRQVRRMIRHESIVTALIGAALGLALGSRLPHRDGRALERGPGPLGARHQPDRVRDRRHPRRDRGRDLPGMTRGEAERAPGVAVRIGEPRCEPAKPATTAGKYQEGFDPSGPGPGVGTMPRRRGHEIPPAGPLRRHGCGDAALRWRAQSCSGAVGLSGSQGLRLPRRARGRRSLAG